MGDNLLQYETINGILKIKTLGFFLHCNIMERNNNIIVMCEYTVPPFYKIERLTYTNWHPSGLRIQKTCEEKRRGIKQIFKGQATSMKLVYHTVSKYSSAAATFSFCISLSNTHTHTLHATRGHGRRSPSRTKREGDV